MSDGGTTNASATETCPQCGGGVPAHDEYASWCECGWNLRSNRPDRKLSPVGRAYEALARRLGPDIERELTASGDLRPRLTAAKAAAYALALGVHAFTLGLVAAAIAAVDLALHGNFLWWVVAVVCAGLAVAARPRLGRAPKAIVPRERAPELYDLADRVADALGTRRVSGIAIGRTLNASFGEVGVRRRRYVVLGLPLLEVLEPQPRVALVAHELAHGANGDSSRGLVIGSAVGALESHIDLVRVGPGLSAAGGVGLLAEVIARVAMRLFSIIPLMLQRVLLSLLFRESQRAEYLADALAARVAGTEAAVEMFDAMHLDQTFRATMLQQLSHRDGDLFDRFRARVARIPERERERLRRVDELDHVSIDVTHPPTASRLRLVRAHPIEGALVTLDQAQAGRLDAELERFRPSIQRDALDAHRDRMYY